jgi:hypothetical protein
MPGAVGEQLLQTLLALDAADHSPSGFPITRLFLRQQRTWRLLAASTRADSRASIVPSEFTL